MLERVSQDGMVLQDATEELKADPEIVMRAVSNNGLSLEFAAEELKGDPKIVMKAVSKNGSALRFATKELKGDPKIVMEAVSQNGTALFFATEELKGDREIVTRAVSRHGFAIRFATKELKVDREIVMRAVSENGLVLQDATQELKGDREIVMEAVSKNGQALEYAIEELKGDREIVMQAVSNNGFALNHVRQELKGDPDTVMEAVSKDGQALEYATKELKGDREIVMRAVSENGYALRHATQELKGDKEMMQHALRPRPGQGNLIGLKVVLLSGRCCDEIFHLQFASTRVVLRRCAELLDLDPDHVERSGALMRGTVEVQERQIAREYSNCDCELKPSAVLRFCCNFKKRGACVCPPPRGGPWKPLLRVSVFGWLSARLRIVFAIMYGYMLWSCLVCSLSLLVLAPMRGRSGRTFSGVPVLFLHPGSYCATGGGYLGGGASAPRYQGPPERLSREAGRPMGPSTPRCSSQSCAFVCLLSC